MHRRSPVLAVSMACSLLLASATDATAASSTAASGRERHGPVELISHDLNGSHANLNSTSPAISTHGRYTAFISFASDIVIGDTNGASDAFLWDARNSRNWLVTKGFDDAPANGNTSAPAIGASGRWVVYSSNATNLVRGDTNNAADIFVTDMRRGKTKLISASPAGAPANGPSLVPAITGDGRYITYASDASNLVTDDPNGHERDVFRFDTDTGTTILISRSASGGGADDASYSSAISADGNVVTFQSDATNLVSGDTNGASDVFAYDVTAASTSVVSADVSGASADGASFQPFISADGRYVSFTSAASDLVPDDANADWDGFLRDRTTGTTRALSVTPDGQPADGRSQFAVVSQDGAWATFLSNASDLGLPARDGVSQVYLQNLATGALTLVSVGLRGKPGNHDSDSTSITGDGRHVAFSSAAGNLTDIEYRHGGDVFRYPYERVPPRRE